MRDLAVALGLVSTVCIIAQFGGLVRAVLSCGPLSHWLVTVGVVAGASGVGATVLYVHVGQFITAGIQATALCFLALNTTWIAARAGQR